MKNSLRSINEMIELPMGRDPGRCAQSPMAGLGVHHARTTSHHYQRGRIRSFLGAGFELSSGGAAWSVYKRMVIMHQTSRPSPMVPKKSLYNQVCRGY